MARTSRKNQPIIVPEEKPAAGEGVYRTGIYLRLSVEDNGKEDGNSMENQQSFLMEYVSSRSYLELTDIYMDNGFTGTDFERPEFNRMLEDAKKGRINCILVKDLSRLGRNYVEAGAYLEKVFPFLHVRFIAVNDNYDSEMLTSGEQLGASLKNIINDMYAKDISRKVGSALKAKRVRGDYIGNYAPYGYLKDPDKPSRLIVDPDIAPVVVEIFEMRAQGQGIATIARALNEKGYPSPGRLRFERGIITNNNKKGKDLPWNRHVLRDLLRNIVYIGDLAQGRSTQCLYKGIPFHWTSEDEWDVAENTHEPIISENLWNKVQKIEQERSETVKSSFGKYAHLPKRENLYGSLLKCADCGRVIKYVRSFAQSGKRAYYNYKCPKNIELGDSACPKKNIRADDLDQAVLEILRNQMEVFVDIRKVLQDLVRREKERVKKANPKVQLQDIQKEIELQKNRSAALYMDYKKGVLTQDEYLYAKQKYQEKLKKLEQKYKELQQVQIKTVEASLGEKHWERIVSEYYNASKLSKEMVHAMVKEIRLHADNRISVTFLYMNEFEELMRQCEQLRKEVA